MTSSVQPWYVREQADADIPALAALLVKVDRAFQPGPFRQDVRVRGLSAAVDVMSRPQLSGVVAELAGVIVGCAALRNVDGHVHLVNVMVDPDCEGRGIGRELVTTLCHRAIFAGQDVYLDVLDDAVRARAMYQSLGFRQVAATRGKVTGRPGAMMRLELGYL